MPGVKTPETNRIVIPPSITIFDENGDEIGFLVDLTEDCTRRLERIRAFSFAQAGRVLQIVPSPEDLSLSGTGIALYESNVLSRIAGPVIDPKEVFRALSHQWQPFAIEIEERHPIGAGTIPGGIKGMRYTYDGCMFERFGRSTRISDLFISESWSAIAKEITTDIITD